MLEHGGRLLRAAQEYDIPPQRWLDLSTGINPAGWPLPPIPREVWTRLPEDEDGLEAVACAAYGAPATLATAGSQAALQALPLLRAQCRAGVLAPAYAEHAQAWRRAGHAVTALPADALADAARGCDVVVVVNPNNPTGARFAREALLALHAVLAARGGWLVVDEAFMDLTPAQSLAADSAREGLIVLRSPGKFFGLAGARAGFVLAAEPLLAALRARLGPWCVAAPTRWLLRQALADLPWQQAARRGLGAAAARLTALLQQHGLVPAGGTDLFQWIPLRAAATWQDALAREAVLVRRFAEPAALRFGLPGDEAGWQHLSQALAAASAGLTAAARATHSDAWATESAQRNAAAMPAHPGAEAASPEHEIMPSLAAEAAEAAAAAAAARSHATAPSTIGASVPATPRRARVLMVQGTTSDAGKSTLVAALCRWLHRRGVAVAPFKPQNMALNSAVTIDGGEIGRAQALQAQAAGVAPHTDFNPILLKPHSDSGAQVIVHGRAIGAFEAAAYHDYKRVALQAVLDSHERLCARYAALVVEGAGSPAEINLRANDIANMGYAEAVDCPVILVADIDRGGVFAHLVGTLALLSASERARVQGFVINRFRGDLALLQPGLDWLERETGKPVLGVLPYLQGLHLDAEDALPAASAAGDAARLRVLVPALPRISNHTDFEALRLHAQVDLRYIGPGQPIPPADLIVLPGSKAVRADLAWLRAQGWEAALQRHLRYGGRLLGICGGLQMLGRSIADPAGLEGETGSSTGLGLLDLDTVLEPGKQLRNVQGQLLLGAEPALTGYEIHCGVSRGAALAQPFAQLADGRSDGARSADGQILATYLHGLFDAPEAGAALLAWAGLADAAPLDRAALREQALERLADAVEAHLDLQRLGALLCPAEDACAH